MADLVLVRPNNALQTFPDSNRYKNRFTIRSESSNQVYMVSFDAADGAGYWTCSCRGNIATGHCKHLRAMGLRGRKHGRDLETLKKMRLI